MGRIWFKEGEYRRVGSRMNIIVDSCFWIALYDAREEDHEWAEETWDKLQNGNKFLVPYPTMYEFINTRLMRREKNVLFFKKLFDSDVVIRISDEQYKEDALRVTLESTGRALSLVDMTIRLMIADDTIKKHALLTLNVGDFNDVCLTKNVEMITRKC
jgi:predicted nucleic acid-binding protein